MAAQIPQSGIDLIKRFEGYATKFSDGRVAAYPDPKDGWNLPTIGYGTTRYANGNAVKQGDIISEAEAERHLIWEVTQRCQPALEKISTWNQMNENQKGALYSFAYNLGAQFYGGSDFQSITKLCDSPTQWGKQDWIHEQFVKYRNPGSPVETGLMKRRQAEAQLFCQPVSVIAKSVLTHS
jgi:GH24 family phage-related lysozyme (muramidase)